MSNKYKFFTIILFCFISIQLFFLAFICYYKFQQLTNEEVNEITKKLKKEQEHKFVLLNSEQKQINNEFYQKIQPINNTFIVRKNNKEGVLKNDGTKIIPIKYDSISYNSGSFIVSKKRIIKNKKKLSHHKFGLFDEDGFKIFPVKYDAIIFYPPFVYLKKKDVFNVYDMNFHYIFSVKGLVHPYAHSKNRFLVVQRDGFLVLNKRGKKIVKIKTDEQKLDNFQFTQIFTSINDEFYTKFKKKGKYGVFDFDGKIIIPPEYDELHFSYVKNPNYQYCFNARKDGKWGRINSQNEILVDFIYEGAIEDLFDGFYKVKIDIDCDNENPLAYSQLLDKRVGEVVYLKKHKEEELKKNHINIVGDLHVVSVYEGKSISDKKINGHPLGSVTVNVSIKNKPISLLLNSYEPVKWIVETEKGVKINKIFFNGYHDSDVVTPSKIIPVEKIYDRSFFDDKDTSFVEKKIGKKPTSFQYKYNSEYFFVDNIDGTKYEKVKKNKSTMKRVEFVCRDRHECILPTSDRLEVEYGNVGPSSISLSNKYYSSGKYYFEAQVKRKRGKISGSYDIGVISPVGGYYECSFSSPLEDGNCFAYGIVPMTENKIEFKNKDIIGVAVDFDSGKLYASKNGKWFIGLPEKEKTYFLFDVKGREYTVAVEVSQNFNWNVNFGAKPFKYRPPKGFMPYDLYSANENEVNI